MYFSKMNYLAHVYLSGTDKEVRLGNYMGDAIKGRDYKNYSESIQKGVLLHRAIDSFTDTHAIYKKHVRWLFPTHRHYSRVIVDVLYDHQLAAHWKHFHQEDLEVYTQKFYVETLSQRTLMPETMQKRFDAMKKYNWLVGYADLNTLETILFQMSQRTNFPSAMHKSVQQMQEEYESFKNDFFDFFSDLKQFSQEKLYTL